MFGFSPLSSFFLFFFILKFKVEGGEHGGERGRQYRERVRKRRGNEREKERERERGNILIETIAHRPTGHLAIFMPAMNALPAGPKQPPKQPATPTKQPPFRRPGDNGP